MAKANTALALPTVTDLAQRFLEQKSAPPELLDLIGHADAGDPAALARLREVYDAFPSIAASVSDLQYATEQEILGTLQPGARETFAEQARFMRKRLAGDDPSPLERLLVNRVVLDWLHALKSDLVLQQRTGGRLSLEAATFYDRHAERAQRRFLRAATTLAQVRRLLMPAVQVNVAGGQVNIGEQQVNVAAGREASGSDADDGSQAARERRPEET